MPAVDLNGDGKTDLALLKHRANMLAWTPGGAYAVPQLAVGQMYAAASSPPPGALELGPLEGYVTRLVRDEHAFVFVDEELLNTSTRPETYVVASTRADIAGIPELEPETPVVFMSAPGGPIPIPGIPDGTRPPGGLPRFDLPRPVEGRPWWWPVVRNPEGDVYLPLREKDYYRESTSGNLGSAAFFGDFHYVPRVYLMRGEATDG